MNIPDRKPCPFCGYDEQSDLEVIRFSDIDLYDDPNSQYYSDMYFVRCAGCGAMGPPMDTTCGIFGPEYPGKVAAVDEWNQRTEV